MFLKHIVFLAYSELKQNINILCIDWEKLAIGLEYVGPANNSIRVGRHVGKKLIYKKLIKKLEQDPKLFHAIGFSLGAHLG